MEQCVLHSNASIVITSSAMLAYLFLPFHQGTKPPFAQVLAHFCCAVAVVVVCTIVFDRM